MSVILQIKKREKQPWIKTTPWIKSQEYRVHPGIKEGLNAIVIKGLGEETEMMMKM